MSRFFIDRPIFAWVIAMLIMLMGILALFKLPIEQYPRIAPPTISISATYPGASAQTIEDSVTQVIEQKMKGLDGLMYMSSSSSSSGAAQITLTFENGTDPDTAQVQVQNKLQSAMSSLPEMVQRMGVNVNKSTSGFLMVLAMTSEDGSMDRADIADYLNSNVVDQISRVEGVGDVNVFGSAYAMRIWLDPEKLRTYGLIPSDITTAIQAQNAQVSAGQLGQTPTDEARQTINATVTVQSYLQTVEAKLKELEPNFPAGLKASVAYDTTPFVRLSIEEVVRTLAEAIALVFLVMFLFLQSWRATIIPTLAVPVVILGTFGILYAFGYTINVLTLFAMVLSIGLLVDDAIVVVENVERLLEENPDMTPLEATRESMREISKVVIGIALILSAVFLPMAFFGGSTGVIYRQFSVTLISSMVLSALVALIFTPALCATILKRTKAHDKHGGHQTGFFGAFNRMFMRLSKGYESFVGRSIKMRWLYMIPYALVIVALVFLFTRIPSSFIPEEDQGILMTLVQLPAGSTQNQTQAVMEKVNAYYKTQEKDLVESVFMVNGFSFAGQGQNMGLAFVRLKDWDERPGKENTAQSIAKRAMGYFMTQVNEAQVYAISPPAIQGLGTATGFDLQLQDSGNLGHEGLLQARNMLLGMAAQSKQVSGVRPNGQEDSPQYKVNVNYDAAAAMGVAPSLINSVLSTAWGSSYVNDFMDRGRIKKVYMQGEAESRTTPEDINKWYVRNSDNQMVPFSSFATGEWQYGSPTLTRYNSLPSMNLQGNAAPGLSTGQAMAAMEQMIAKLPKGISYEWTGLSLEEKKSGAQAPMLYAISIVVVFLCLAALYESWSIPFAVLLVVPLGVLGAVLFTGLRGLSNDIYLQVGLLTVVGLSAKNAILIIEFAKERQDLGYSLYDSVTVAARQRLRPIIMTSLAFGIGVVPLFLATGAGSGSQNAIGTSVLGGVVSATILGVFFIPMFYVWIRSLIKGNKPHHPNDGNDGNDGDLQPVSPYSPNPAEPVAVTQPTQVSIYKPDDSSPSNHQ